MRCSKCYLPQSSPSYIPPSAMPVIRILLIGWSVLGIAGVLLLLALFAGDAFMSPQRVVALLLWAGLYGLNVYYLVRCTECSGAKL